MKKLPVLLISGWAHGAEAMHSLAEALAGSHTASFSLAVPRVAPSVCTRGQNDAANSKISAYARTISRCLDKSGEPACIVGWSTGGMAAIETAVNYPEKVAALVLLSSTARFCSVKNSSAKQSSPVYSAQSLPRTRFADSLLQQEYTAGVDPAVLRLMIRGLKRNPEAVIADFLTQALHPVHIPADELARRTKNSLEQGTDCLIDGLEYLASADFRDALPAIPAPCLIIHGRQDRIVPWQAAQYLASNLTVSIVEFLPSAGHSLIEQCGKDLINRIKQFVGSLT